MNVYLLYNLQSCFYRSKKFVRIEIRNISLAAVLLAWCVDIFEIPKVSRCSLSTIYVPYRDTSVFHKMIQKILSLLIRSLRKVIY